MGLWFSKTNFSVCHTSVLSLRPRQDPFVASLLGFAPVPFAKLRLRAFRPPLRMTHGRSLMAFFTSRTALGGRDERRKPFSYRSTFSLSPSGRKFHFPEGEISLGEADEGFQRTQGSCPFPSATFSSFLPLRQISLSRTSQCFPFSLSLAPEISSFPFRENFTVKERQLPFLNDSL